MKILISIDGSEHSDFALTDACETRWPEQSEIKIVTAVDESFGTILGSQKDVDTATALLEHATLRVRDSASNSNLDSVSTQLLRGNPKNEILKFAEAWKPDLLIVGSRGRRGLQRILLGSVSHALLLATACSVRIARKPKNPERSKPHRVMVPLDNSDSSSLVIKHIGARPWSPGTEFLCVFASPTLAQLLHEGQDSHSVHELERARSEQIEDATRFLNRSSKMLCARIANITASYEILDGDPRESIVERTEQWDAELVIIGCKGKHLLDRIMIGSVSEAVATWAPCSVEVVKA